MSIKYVEKFLATLQNQNRLKNIIPFNIVFILWFIKQGGNCMRKKNVNYINFKVII